MPDRLFRGAPFPASPAPSPDDVLADTLPEEPLSMAGAEARLREVQAQIANIGRQLEDRSARRSARWACDPDADWRRSAIAARALLRDEQKELRRFLEEERARLGVVDAAAARVADLERQELDRATRGARRLVRKEHLQPLWEAYLQAEVALLAILGRGVPVGPLGDAVLACARSCVPEWYREYWLRAVYRPRWCPSAPSDEEPPPT